MSDFGVGVGPPVDLEALRVVADALRLLSTAGFPARLRCLDPTKPMDDESSRARPCSAATCRTDGTRQTGRYSPVASLSRRTAVAAAAWICAFNARWQVALLDHDLSDDYPHVIQVQQRQDDYLGLNW